MTGGHTRAYIIPLTMRKHTVSSDTATQETCTQGRSRGTVQLHNGARRPWTKGQHQMKKVYYNPRFGYSDFDSAIDEDNEIFWKNMRRFHSIEKKVRDRFEERDVSPKDYLI